MKKVLNCIEYGEELIVIVHFEKEWMYFVSDKDLWILDQKAWAYSFHEAGYDVPLDDYSDRFDIPLLDENVARIFLDKMQEFKVSLEMLKDVIAEKYANKKMEEESQYFPALLVDFDRKELISYFPEPFPFEKFIPPAWSGSYANFLGKIPASLQYWKF
jgi:hypothetical protein